MNTEKAEEDVAVDEHVAGARDTGGVAAEDATGDPARENQDSTTSSTPTPEYVGRVAGDDVGYAGETGAEARATE